MALADCCNNIKLNFSKVEIDFSTVLKIAVGSFMGATAIYCFKVIHSYSFFKSRGIKTPKYKYFFGNFDRIKQVGFSNAVREWTEELGKTYGYYEGHFPILITSDLDIIQEVFFNQVGNFTARKQPPFVYDDNAPDLILVAATRNRWKRLRTIINPTFTPSKLKQLTEMVNMCSERLTLFIESNLEKEINLNEKFNNFAMDVVWNTAFGMDIDCQNNKTNKYIIKSQAFFTSVNKLNPLILLAIYFHDLKRYFLPLIRFLSSAVSKVNPNLSNPFFWILDNLKEIVEYRIENKTKRKDYIQLLLESVSEQVDSEKDLRDYDSSNVDVDKKMTKQELAVNLAIFLFAGTETISITLANCMYVLAKYPDELKKLQREIDEEFDFTKNSDDEVYENANKLEYLDMFIKEVLRMYPVGNAVLNRRCTNATEVKGIKIPEGMVIGVDVMSLHFDQEHWGSIDTNQFDPLRFTAGSNRSKLVYMPFGLGSRNCIGMRFALLEIKLTLIKLLKNYDVYSNRLNEKLVYTEIGPRRPRDGIKCIFKKRSVEQ